MSTPFGDTDLIVRLLTGDDTAKQARVAALFERISRGEAVDRAPDTVIADAVFVLGSRRLYGLPREQVSAMLSALVRLPGFHVDNRRTVLRALAIFGARNLDFGDAVIAAAVEEAGEPALFSFDRDFDRLPNITCREP
jgi:predicted nucleic-acid-binding protein